VIYGTGLILAFGVSGIYHRLRIKPRLAGALRRLDHSTIFIMVGTSYTPFLLLGLDGETRVALMIAVWSLCALGIVARLSISSIPRWVMAASYTALGGAAIFLIPVLSSVLSGNVLTLVAVGGALYATGAVVYVAQRPDPFPNGFGFHEVFHMFIIGGAVCHYAAIWRNVTGEHIRTILG
jgi:hemolysin III